MTYSPPSSQKPAQTEITPLYKQVESYVTKQVSLLLHTQTSGSTTALLAHLRTASTKSPGTVPQIWDITIDGAPGAGISDTPSNAEQALHTALTLFALHQQGRRDKAPAHQRGSGLGQSVRRLEAAYGGSGDGGHRSPVRRRFDGLVAASTFDALAYHLRSLVSQLRAKDIPVDYGLLAIDLYNWQKPARRDSVKRRWARDFYRNIHSKNTTVVSSEENELSTNKEKS